MANDKNYPLIAEYQEILPPEEVFNLPIEPGYHPLSSCYLQGDPVDISKWGYVEEEYVIRSHGDIYVWPKEEPRPVVRAANGLYCSRFLVRKPADPKKFSGVVVFEAFNNGGKISNPTCLWPAAYDHILDSGDAWIGVEVQYLGFKTMKNFDPERYKDFDLAFNNPVPPEERGPLGWHVLREAAAKRGFKYGLELPDDFEKGFIFDEFFQIAALCKRCGEGDPFYGYDVKKVCIASVFDLNAFIAGFHPYKRMPGGAPVFDGYLKYMSGSGGELSREADMWWHDDPRAQKTCDVPVIRIETAGDLRDELPHPSWACLRRMEDCDEPGKQSRWYELAGLSVSHSTPHAASNRANKACYDKVGEEQPRPDTATEDPLYNFGAEHLVTGAYRNLKDWMLFGTPPPSAPVIQLTGEYPEVNFVLDELGNHVGGVRSSYVDVPFASYDDVGGEHRFTPEKLRELYGTRDEFMDRIRAHCEKHAADRWITPKCAEKIIAQAQLVEF